MAAKKKKAAKKTRASRSRTAVAPAARARIAAAIGGTRPGTGVYRRSPGNGIIGHAR